jgi:hypothetical protein
MQSQAFVPDRGKDCGYKVNFLGRNKKIVGKKMIEVI